MKTKVVTVPGFHGSDANHWQTWLEQHIPNSERVEGIDWAQPQIFTWANAIENHIDATPERVILVAHSFGCLASALVASRHPEKVAGLILVAPASPQRFSLTGPIGVNFGSESDISSYLPKQRLQTLGLLVASTNDPWMEFGQSEEFGRQWGMALYNAGDAGHINSAAGYGEWPLIKELVTVMQASVKTLTENSLCQQPNKLIQETTLFPLPFCA